MTTSSLSYSSYSSSQQLDKTLFEEETTNQTGNERSHNTKEKTRSEASRNPGNPTYHITYQSGTIPAIQIFFHSKVLAFVAMTMKRMKSFPPRSIFLMLWIASTTLRNRHPQRENSHSSSNGVLPVEAAAWMGSTSSTFGSTFSKSYLASSQKKNGIGGADFGSFLSNQSGARSAISHWSCTLMIFHVSITSNSGTYLCYRALPSLLVSPRHTPKQNNKRCSAFWGTVMPNRPVIYPTSKVSKNTVTPCHECRVVSIRRSKEINGQ
jgi:hypothetical protein